MRTGDQVILIEDGVWQKGRIIGIRQPWYRLILVQGRRCWRNRTQIYPCPPGLRDDELENYAKVITRL